MPVLPKSKVNVLVPAWQHKLDDHVISVAWSPDSQWLAAACVSGPIQIFYAKDGSKVCRLPGHAFGTTMIGWSPNGKQFASAGQDGKIKYWDMLRCFESHSMDAGSAWVEAIAWGTANGSGPLLASAAGKKLRLWTMDGELLRDYPDHPSTISDVKWRPLREGAKEERLASAAYGQLAFWQAKSNEPVTKLEWKGSLLTIAWSPDGAFVATGNQDSTVHFWFVKSGEDLQMSGYPTKVRELSWDFNSRYLATGGGDQVTIWDCSGKGPADTKPIVLKGHQGVLHSLAYQPYGVLLASGGDDGMVALWNPKKEKKPIGVHVLEDAVSQVVWSPDSRNLAVAGHNGEVGMIRVSKSGD